MQLDLKSGPAKIALMTIEVAIFIILTVWVARTYFASLVAEKPVVKNLESALRFDPSNADYALSLGRLYQYTVLNARPELALQDLTRAARLNPYDPQAWLDLGTALEFEGETQKAEVCMRRAGALAPHVPRLQWAIGNFFLLHRDTDEAFAHFKMVLAAGFYQEAIYNIAWKASDDASKILAELIPEDAGSELSYLSYLVSTHRLEDAAPVWNRIAASPDKFPAESASPYLDALLIAQKPEQAYQVWTVLRVKGLIPATYEATAQNLVENGDFEGQPLNFGFDWRLTPANGVYVDRDDSTFHSPARSLVIQFPGTENFSYHNFYEFVPVKPDHTYHLVAFMKTEGITTDSGPKLEVRDAFHPEVLDKYSDQLTGTSPSWVPLTIDFKTPSHTNLILVGIARVPSEHFDNQIKGKVWVDDVDLTLAGIGPESE